MNKTLAACGIAAVGLLAGGIALHGRGGVPTADAAAKAHSPEECNACADEAKEPASDVPIACKLSRGELAERKVVLATLTEGIVERKNVDGGVALRFKPEPGVVQRLARLVDLERECCPFIRFDLRVEPAEGPIWLELTGPKPAEGMVRELFPAESKRK